MNKYFAYGSNMNWEQMQSRCPSAKFLMVAVLRDHRLAFSRYSKGRCCGVADVIDCPGSNVWGVVYEVSDEDMCKLDTSEGYKYGREINSYNREKKTVCEGLAKASSLQVFTYVAEQQEGEHLPDKKYLGLIIDGAHHWKLPADYIVCWKR